MYYIASLAKFGNCYSMTSAVGKANGKGKNFGISFSEEAAKKIHIVLQCNFRHDFIYLRVLQKFRVSKTQCQYVLLLWWSGTVATVLRSLKSVVRKYVSLRIIFCLYHPDLHLISPISSLDPCTFIILEPACVICPARVLSEDDSWFSWQVLNSSK